jgi:hypothetical protein
MLDFKLQRAVLGRRRGIDGLIDPGHLGPDRADGGTEGADAAEKKA